MPVAITMVEVPRLQLTYVTGDRITAAHLRASCAIPLGYPPVKIGGKYYVDGGLLGPVPLWAAAEMGATSAVVINALQFMPSLMLRATVGALRAVAAPKTRFPNIEVKSIAPSEPLGTVRDALFWKEENVRRWIALGERDAAALSPLRHGATEKQNQDPRALRW
jgi:NTE family protein